MSNIFSINKRHFSRQEGYGTFHQQGTPNKAVSGCWLEDIYFCGYGLCEDPHVAVIDIQCLIFNTVLLVFPSTSIIETRQCSLLSNFQKHLHEPQKDCLKMLQCFPLTSCLHHTQYGPDLIQSLQVLTTVFEQTWCCWNKPAKERLTEFASCRKSFLNINQRVKGPLLVYCSYTPLATIARSLEAHQEATFRDLVTWFLQSVYAVGLNWWYFGVDWSLQNQSIGQDFDDKIAMH